MRITTVENLRERKSKFQPQVRDFVSFLTDIYRALNKQVFVRKYTLILMKKKTRNFLKCHAESTESRCENHITILSGSKKKPRNFLKCYAEYAESQSKNHITILSGNKIFRKKEE